MRYKTLVTFPKTYVVKTNGFFQISELGEFQCDLDGTFQSIRTKETNLGNFICDIMVRNLPTKYFANTTNQALSYVIISKASASVRKHIKT